ncbi:MAG: hypothetical protein H0W55_10615 [Actinobacteria bacterium]|nr:hypothetical protein [Actinomycetota bacterium]
MRSALEAEAARPMSVAITVVSIPSRRSGLMAASRPVAGPPVRGAIDGMTLMAFTARRETDE